MSTADYVYVEHDPDDFAFYVYCDTGGRTVWSWYEKRTPVNEAISVGYCGA